MPNPTRLLIDWLKELSLVRRPANQPSLIHLHKSADAADTGGTWFPKWKSWLEKRVAAIRADPKVVAKDAAIARAVEQAHEAAILKTAPDIDPQSGEEIGTVDSIDKVSDEEFAKEITRRGLKLAKAGKNQTHDPEDENCDCPDCDPRDGEDGEDDGEGDDAEKSADKIAKAIAAKLGAPAPVKKTAAEIRFEKVEAENTALKKSIAAEIEKREASELLVIAKEMAGNFGAAKPEVVASILKVLAPDQRKQFGEILKSAREQQRGLMLIKGSDESVSPGAMAELEKHAADIRKAEPKLTREQAFTKACDQHPDLFREANEAKQSA